MVEFIHLILSLAYTYVNPSGMILHSAGAQYCSHVRVIGTPCPLSYLCCVNGMEAQRQVE